MERKKLTEGFATHNWLIHKFTEGLTHEESLLRLLPRVNNFNWVLGHIVQSRSKLLVLLDADPLWDEQWAALYETGADKLADDTAVPLPDLLKLVDSSLGALQTAVTNASDEALNALYDTERQITVAQRIEGVQWHETYHTGQLEILRQAGSEKPAFP